MHMRVLFRHGNSLKCKEIAGAYYDEAREELILQCQSASYNIAISENEAESVLHELLVNGYCDLGQYDART